MISTLPRENARSRAVLAAVLLTALGPASCGRSGESGGEGAGGGETKVSTAVFAADCCTPGQHTACQDGRWCSGEEQCDCWGNCEVGAPPNCDDGDMCTDDACVDDVVVAYGTGVGTGHCQHVCVPGPTCICPECTVPADCDDGDACTDDACVDNMCEYGETNCDDGDFCTDDTCDSATGCQHTVRPDCCTTAADCDDLVTCTIDDCNLSTHTCTHTLQDGWCEIAGICYADGTVNPVNECESCQYLYQPDRWTGLPTGTPCEDSLYCTLDQACDGDGRCVGAGSPCADDGLTCTETVCNEATDTCFSRVYDGFCLIGGVCYVNGNPNPANECQRCWSTTSKTAWSPLAAGTGCDDSRYCTVTDRCDGAGTCVGTVNPCPDDGVECTDNNCAEAAGGFTCSYPPSANRCYIGGTCYTNGDIDASPNNCRWCYTPTSQTAWTNRPNGTSCDDGSFCNGVDLCNGAGTCNVAPPPCTAPTACTTATCNEVADTCGYTIWDNWCYISGTCYTNNTDRPGIPCQWCQSAVSKTWWRSKAAGTACDDNLWCNLTDTCNGSGSCNGSGDTCDDLRPCTADSCNEAANTCTNATNAGTCLIGGDCYADGDPNPLNRCQWCQSAVSNGSWTNKPNGTSCDDGSFCNGVDLCNGAGTCNVAPPPCTAPTACTTATCNEVTDTCDFYIYDGSCYIGGVCYADNDSNPGNVCQRCWSLTSKVAWTTRPDGPVAGCTGAIDQCNNRSCLGGACGAVPNTGTPCTYLPDVCHDPGSCLSDGTCGAGPHVYPANDVCPNTLPIAIDGSVSGSTLCALNDYSGSCGGSSAPDLVYQFTIPVSNDYQIYAHNVIHASPFDGLVYVRDACTDAGSVYCNDDCTDGRFLTCASYGLDADDAGFMIPVMPSDQSKTWYLVADGWDAASYGDFTVQVDRVNYNNNSCSTLEDTDYVVDATNGGIFRGNITGYTNTFICPFDNNYLGNKCDCNSGDTACANGNGTQGLSTHPARAFFKLAPSAATTYCIHTDESAPADPFDAVIDAWRLVEADGTTNATTCDHNPRAMQTGTTPTGGCHYGAGAANAQLQINSVAAGEVRIIGVSTYCGDTPGTQYEVHFDIGTCP